jgi:uncharacterized membrane protein YhaH (DUF805 family)
MHFFPDSGDNGRQMMALFSFRGRIGRVAYFITLLTTSILSCVFAAATEVAATAPMLLFRFASLLVLLCIWVWLAAAVKRFHDIGRSGWLVMTFLVPVVNLIVGLILLFMPGKRDAIASGSGQEAASSPAE